MSEALRMFEVGQTERLLNDFEGPTFYASQLLPTIGL